MVAAAGYSRNMRGLTSGDSSEPTTNVGVYLYAPPLHSPQLLREASGHSILRPSIRSTLRSLASVFTLSTSSKNPQTAATINVPGCSCVHRTSWILQARDRLIVLKNLPTLLHCLKHLLIVLNRCPYYARTPANYLALCAALTPLGRSNNLATQFF